MTNDNIFYLFFLFQIKHFFCDFIFQNDFMLQKSKEFPHFIAPLFFHSFVHGIITFVISITLTNDLFLSFNLFLIDLSTHFFIDRIKASRKYLGKFKPNCKYFWWSLGFDQMCHHMISCIIIYILVCQKCL